MEEEFKTDNSKRKILSEITAEFFKASLLTYFILYIIEDINSGMISKYFSLDALLIITVVAGGATAFLIGTRSEDQKQIFRKIDFILIIIISIVGGGVIFIKLKDLGMIAYLVSFLAVIMTILLSVLIFKDNKTNDTL